MQMRKLRPTIQNLKTLALGMPRKERCSGFVSISVKRQNKTGKKSEKKAVEVPGEQWLQLPRANNATLPCCVVRVMSSSLKEDSYRGGSELPEAAFHRGKEQV